ncbi:sulfotransferase [Aquipuribacter sp. SD81]|uniref:sulfotransferase n=1 Tax=Aquipuribacter sp. SD81 TaxID=3127703 RepID=UPI003019DFE8
MTGPDSTSGRALPTVLMLGGFGRSGSTLLERMLGDVPGVVAVGEVLHLWERGVRDDERCGCGEPFSRCPFWREVGQRALGGWPASPSEADAVVIDRYDVVRNRHLPGLVTGLLRRRRRAAARRLLDRHLALYRAVSAGSGAGLVVDSSKHPAFAYLLRRSELDLRCLVVARDPRGVAWSWQKTVGRPEVTSSREGVSADMPRYGVAVSAVRWSLYGALFHALSLLGVPVDVIRYEDLLARPREELQRVLSFAGFDVQPGSLSHLDATSVTMSTHHTVAGNPMRFRTGRVDLRPDTEWRERMPRLDRLVVELLTLPLRLWYGYRR